jgi:hypothetical protein
MRLPRLGEVTPAGLLQYLTARSDNRWVVAGAFALLVLGSLRRRVRAKRGHVRIDLRDGGVYQVAVSKQR